MQRLFLILISLFINQVIAVVAIPSNVPKKAKETESRVLNNKEATRIDKIKDYLDKNDYEKAISLGEKEYKKEKNSTVALYLGKAYFLKQSYDDALKYFNEAATKGEALAMLTLGNLYGSGAGVKQDYNKAIMWYKKAIDKGNIAAMNYLGLIYRDGIESEVKKDPKEAMELFNRAAKLQSDEGYFNLGYMHHYGLGIKKNYKEAIKSYVQAANLGNVLAMTNLAYIYENGEGVKQSYRDALNWYMLAAAKGDANAECSVGEYYFNGKGVKNDHVIAKNWFLRGQKHGCKIAGEYLAKIASEK